MQNLPVKKSVWAFPHATRTTLRPDKPSISVGTSRRTVSPWPSCAFSFRPMKTNHTRTHTDHTHYTHSSCLTTINVFRNFCCRPPVFYTLQVRVSCSDAQNIAVHSFRLSPEILNVHFYCRTIHHSNKRIRIFSVYMYSENIRTSFQEHVMMKEESLHR